MPSIWVPKPDPVGSPYFSFEMKESVRIRVCRATRDNLAQTGVMGEGWDCLINRLIDEKQEKASQVRFDPQEKELCDFIEIVANQLHVDDEKLSPYEVTSRVYGLFFLLLGSKKVPDPFEVINRIGLLEYLLLDSDPFVQAMVMMMCLLTYFVKTEGLEHLRDELMVTRGYLIDEYKRRINFVEDELSIEA